MDFNIIWECDIGTTINVSDGIPEPSPKGMLSVPWKIWFSRNFTGTITNKYTSNNVRYIQAQVTNYGDRHPTYTLSELMKLTFSSNKLNTAALIVYEPVLLEQVDAKATVKMPLMDALLIYAKWQEVRDINDFGLSNAVALPANEREARFPFMVAEFNENPGMTPQEVLDRFTTQTQNKLIKAGKIEARRSKIIRDIAAATTQAEKEAAANTSWDDI